MRDAIDLDTESGDICGGQFGTAIVGGGAVCGMS